jgi:hypothetical protein
VKVLPDGTVIRNHTLISPQEALHRKTVEILESRTVRPQGPDRRVDTRHATALAVAQLFGFKLASDKEQEAALSELRTGLAPTKRRAQRIGLGDLLIAITNWQEVPADAERTVPGVMDPDSVKKAAYRCRWHFVLSDMGWTEKGPENRTKVDESTADPRDEFEMEILVDEATKVYLASLTEEQRALFQLRFEGWTKKECGVKLRWDTKRVERVWRSLGTDRDGKSLHDQLVFWAVGKYRHGAN